MLLRHLLTLPPPPQPPGRRLTLTEVPEGNDVLDSFLSQVMEHFFFTHAIGNCEYYLKIENFTKVH